MSPSSGHLLVPKVGRIIRFAYTQAKTLVRAKVPTPTTANNVIFYPLRQHIHTTDPVHHVGATRPSRIPTPSGHGHTGSPRRFTTGTKYNRSHFPSSRTSRTIAAKGSAPFASTLRPNLTGGTLPRSSGGYGIGRVRHFSHTGGCQAQVIQNVSAGIRAFLVEGKKARFDGVDTVTGEHRWKTVSEPEDHVYKHWETSTPFTKGTNLDFQLSPTITALAPTMDTTEGAVHGGYNAQTTLNTPTLLPKLATDFARALRDLSLVQHDLARLSAFGELPLSLKQTDYGPTLTVRFPGCDAEAVSRLCDEVGVRRGIIREDDEWTSDKDAEMALLFPLAPFTRSPSGEDAVDSYDEECRWFSHRQHPAQMDSVEWRDMHSTFSRGPSSDHDFSTSHDPLDSHSEPLSPIELLTPQHTSHAGNLSDSGGGSEIYYDGSSPLPSTFARGAPDSSTHGGPIQAEDFEGVEGIYRFLQECDDARRP